MPRVLIPTDDQEIIPALVEGYRHLGYEVVTGAKNFFWRGCRFDLVHFLWPEELSAWQVPSQQKLARIKECLEWWSAQTKTLISVNNLLPHGHEDNLAFRSLYEMFYSRCDTILHHSRASMQLVAREFPLSTKRRNVVATMFNYDRYLPARLDREKARSSFGFNSQDFVILIFGALRKHGEIRLIKSGYLKARVPHKRLLMAGRFVAGNGGVRGKCDSKLWEFWLRANRAVAVSDFIPEEDVHRYCEAADVIVVPRLNDLSSGLVGLAATFSRLLIAPNHGSFPDYLAGTDNILYQSGNADSLAEAIEAATRVDREKAGLKNRAVADSWTWDRILQAALSPDEEPVSVSTARAG